MIDIVEIQQFISNMPSVEKVASSPQVAAVNLANITQKEMEIADEVKLSTVLESEEVLKPVNDQDKKSARKDGGNSEKGKEEAKDEEGKESSAEEPVHHIDLTV